MDPDDAPARTTTEACPKCGAGAPYEILYGLVVGEVFERANELGFALGGCSIEDGCPEWQCRACGAEWGLYDEWE